MQTQSHLPSDPRQEAFAKLLDDPDPRVALFARLLLAMPPKTVPDRAWHRNDDRRGAGRGELLLRSRSDADADDARKRCMEALQEVSRLAKASEGKMQFYAEQISCCLDDARARDGSAIDAGTVGAVARSRRERERRELDGCDIREFEFAAQRQFLLMTQALAEFHTQYIRYFGNYEFLFVCEPLALTAENERDWRSRQREDREPELDEKERKERTRKCAYALWEKAGCPPNREKEFYYQAERELSQARSGS